MTIDLQLQDINITSLKEAPIHLFNEIQPHGILLVLQEPELKILQVSKILSVFSAFCRKYVANKIRRFTRSFPNPEN